MQQSLSPETLRASDEAIARQLLASDAYRRAKRVFAYYSTDGEVGTHSILADAVKNGKTAALPVSGPDGQMEFYRYDGALRSGRYGIMEPDGGQVLVPGSEDLMLVPGLCYDREGYRLGRGGGYYDRYLSRYRCVTVGLCRAVLVADRLPRTWNDVPVDHVITESGLLK